MKQRRGVARSAAANDVVERATAAIEQGRPAEAERILRDHSSKRPLPPDALHELGRALLAQNRSDEAIAPLERAARHLPDPVVETNLALALNDSGRKDEAVQWLEQATSRQPPFAAAFYELGVLLLSLGKSDEAEAVLQRGLEAAPPAVVVELSMVLGGLYLNRADWDNAKMAFARALVNAPGHPGALHGFGAALMEEGDYVRAAERFRQALAKDSTDFQSRLSLGACQLELGRQDEGLASLRAAVCTTPSAYPMALKIVVTSARGRFWLRPSAAAKLLQKETAA